MSDAAPVLTQERAAPADNRPRHARDATPRPWLVTAGVALVYLALSVLANRNAWAHGIAHTIQTAGGNDVPEEIWFLAQTPWVLLHAHNPLVNNWLNAPSGINLMDNTTMPLLGIVGFPDHVALRSHRDVQRPDRPVDLRLGHELLRHGPALRRLVAGGVHRRAGLRVLPLHRGHGQRPPLPAVPGRPTVGDPLRRPLLPFGTTSAVWSGVAVGLCFVAEFYISTESFASLAVMTGVAAVLGLGLVLWKHVALDRRRVVTFAGCAVIVVALGIGYGAWLAVAGPHHITGPAQPATALAGVTVDPLGFVVPTLDQHFTFGHAALGDSLVASRDANWNIVFDSPIENGSYIGIPLLLALVAASIVLRRKRIALFCTAMGVIALIMSLGSHLHVDGHRTGIPLPFIVIEHLPLLNSSVASRWITYFWLFAALLLALLLDAVYKAVPADGRLGRAGGAVASGLLAVVVLLPLLPAWPYVSAPASVPAWFTSGARSLPAGSTALVYPIANSSDDSGMLWQAMAQMQFRQPGGFAVIPGPNGANTFNGDPSPLEGALAQCEEGTTAAPDFPPAAVRAQLRQWQAQTVVVVPTGPGAACATTLFTGALGPPEHVGGVLVWPHLDAGS